MNTLRRLGQFFDDAIASVLIAGLIAMVVSLFVAPILWVLNGFRRPLDDLYIEAFIGAVQFQMFVLGIGMLLFSFAFLLVLFWFAPVFFQGVIWAIATGHDVNFAGMWINNTLLSMICVIPIIILIGNRVVMEIEGFREGWKEGKAEREAEAQARKAIIEA